MSLFGLSPHGEGGPEAGSDATASAHAAGEFDTQFDVLQLLMAADDSAEVVRATLMLACANERHLDLLNDCVLRELDKSISVGTLFRTNSITTKFVREFLLLSTYTFLHASLATHVRKIVDDPSGYECDPAKLNGDTRVGERLKRVALAADGILASVAQHLTCVSAARCCRCVACAPSRLLARSHCCWCCPLGFCSHLCRSQLPLDVRRFFGNTRAAVQIYFPDAYRTVAAGFLFLRFLCPAIFSPVMFGLVSEKIGDEAQRALILVAKVLQVTRSDPRCAFSRTRSRLLLLLLLGASESGQRRRVWQKGAVSGAAQRLAQSQNAGG